MCTFGRQRTKLPSWGRASMQAQMHKPKHEPTAEGHTKQIRLWKVRPSRSDCGRSYQADQITEGQLSRSMAPSRRRPRLTCTPTVTLLLCCHHYCHICCPYCCHQVPVALLPSLLPLPLQSTTAATHSRPPCCHYCCHHLPATLLPALPPLPLQRAAASTAATISLPACRHHCCHATRQVFATILPCRPPSPCGSAAITATTSFWLPSLLLCLPPITCPAGPSATAFSSLCC